MSNYEDVNFVNMLHAQKNAKIDYKVLLLFFSIILFFAGAFTWAYFSQIDELTRGEGKVIPSEKIKTIQSLDGGLISEILVKEGSIVKKGQQLMKIDTTRFEASLEENKQTYFHLLVTKIRLDAESKIDLSKPIPELVFPEEVLKEANTFAQNDKKLFKSRIEELKSTTEIFKIQLKQKEQEVKELRNTSAQLRRNLALVKEETRTMELLVKRRSKSKVDLIRIKKELSQLRGDLQSTYINIPKAKYAMEEAKNRISEKAKIFRAEASNELQKLNTEIKKYESKLVSENDKLEKTILPGMITSVDIITGKKSILDFILKPILKTKQNALHER